jgi:hypothetical protein
MNIEEDVMYRATRVLKLSLALIFLFVALCSHSYVWAQGSSTTASLTGSVTDEQGAVIGGATVTAKNIETNLSREALSGTEGNFLLQQLPPGDYEVTVLAEGFNTTSSRINLLLGTTARFDFVMKVGTTADIIEVVAANVMDDGKTESSTNIDTMRIETLPINRRNFLDFSLTSARVVADRVPGQGASATSGLSFNGQSARFNNITIDGLDNNDIGSGSVRSTFSQDAVQEFQVVSDSYSAEFGRALGGIVNIVTRGGSNDFHGNLFFFLRNDETSARDVFTPFKPEYKQYQFGTVLSGPIKKDKLFFFGSFERLSIKQNNFVTISDQSVRAAVRQGFTLRNGPVPFSVGTTSVLSRLDARLSDNDSIFVRYNFGGTYNGALEPFGGLIGETNGGIQNLDDNLVAVNNTYINTNLNLVNETRFLYNRRNQIVLPLEAGPQVRIVAPEGQIIFGRGTFLPQPRQARTYQIVDNVSLTRGRNQIKFGIDYQRITTPGGNTKLPIFPGGLAFFQAIDFSAATGLPGLPFFTGLQAFDPASRTPQQQAFLTLLSSLLPAAFPGFPAGVPLTKLALPTAYFQGFGDPSLEIDADFFSLFFQNDIKLRPNLLLKAGVRYDVNKVTFMPDNDGNFSPRVALAYRPSKLPKMNVRAAFGVFFGIPLTGPSFAIQLTTSGQLKIPVIPFPFAVLPFAMQGHRLPEGNQIPAGTNFVPQLSQSFTYQPDLRNGYTQQASFGIDYLIANNTAVSLSYNYVRGVKLFGPRNINPVVRPIPGNPLQSAVVGRVDPTRGDLFQFESSFDSYFHGFTISVNRRLTNRFGFLVNYTFSKAIDNFIDIRTDLQEVDDPLQPRKERGLSLQDVRNRFVLSGIWDLNYTKNPFLTGFQISTILNLNSGRPYNLLAGQDLNLNGDNPPGDRPLGLGRNVGITPGFANLDLRVTKTVVINERYRFQGFIEAFNLFNRVNISDVDRIFPMNAQGGFNLPPKDGSRFIATEDRFRGAFAPRQFQLGLRFSF